MDILILGNGFDLAHGLDTRYSDFLKYYEKKYSSNRNTEIANDENFLYNNVWAKHFLNKTLDGDKWIDLEREIYNVILKLSKLSYFKNSIHGKRFNEIAFFISKDYWKFNFDEAEKYFCEPKCYFNRDCYCVPIKDFINFLYNQLRDFVREFENYLTEEENRKIKSTPKYNLRINSDCISLLNFNYTDTCEQLYKINFNHNNFAIKTKAVYVHGKINNENGCNMVLGTHNFDNEQIPVEFNIFKKHHQRHRYGTIEPYQELLNELKHPSHNKIYIAKFHIMGHSLDITDHSILRNILLAKDKSIINIYYNDEEALARMQNNIDLIIGEEEVMAKVKFIKQYDLQKGILIPQKELEEVLT
ncbi:MAG: bacteriophage abortive infection AbiH family protein [Candidatus Gastranaerophilales bacterium]|nr:bacteriophage abortive infection AbiH family protein [Candidatus Gastranaerophilales bacterium]MCM1073274.1 bacteriophage abortive infection AbiH family protein [Bacteroides sp.]